MGRLNYHHLRYFRTVAREGNLTRAARHLNVSQSAVSTQIRQLEMQLGHDLLDRAGRGISLTEAGRIVLDYADVIFETGDDLLAVLRREGSGARPLRIGALATLSRNFLITILRPLSDAGVRIVLRSGTTSELLARLNALALDVIVLNHPPSDLVDAGLVSHRLAEQDVSLIGTPELIDPSASPTELLASRPLVLPNPQSSVRAHLDAMLARLGIEPRIAVEADDMAMLRLLARDGVGLAVIPPVVVRDELSTGVLVDGGHLPGISETFYAVTGKRRFPNPATSLLLDSAIGQKLAP